MENTDLLPVLAATFSSNAEVRTEAEKSLALAKLLPGFLPYLFQIALTSE